MFNHLQSPFLNSVKSQSQLIKHVLTNPSRQLSVKHARLPRKQKHSTNMSIAPKNPLLISGTPHPPGNTMIFTPPSGRGLVIPSFFRGFCFGGHLPQTSGFCSAKEILVVSFATQPRAFILSDRNIFCTPQGGEQWRGLIPLGLFLLRKPKNACSSYLNFLNHEHSNE